MIYGASYSPAVFFAFFFLPDRRGALGAVAVRHMSAAGDSRF